MASNGDVNNKTNKKKRKRRWGTAPAAASPQIAAVETPSSKPVKESPTTPKTTTKPTSAGLDSKAKALALKASVQAKLAALKAAKQGGKKIGTAITTTKLRQSNKQSLQQPQSPSASILSTSSSLSSSTKRPATEPTSQSRAQKRAKHYELDMNVTAPTFKETKVAQPSKPKINPYLAHKASASNDKSEDDIQQQQQKEGSDNDQTAVYDNAAAAATANEQDDDIIIDDRLERQGKIRKRHKTMNFVEPGTFVQIAERKRLKAANAEQSGFVSGRKTGMYVSSSTMMANVYGSTEVADEHDQGILPNRVEATDKTTMPQIMEWWDMELLPSKLKKQVAAHEGNILSKEAKSQMMTFDTSTKNGNKDANNDDEKPSASSNNDGNSTPATTAKDDNVEHDKAETLRETCFEQASLSYSKTAALVQHIIPIKNGPDPPEVQPTLYLTKRELKRRRKLRRQEKQRELQDMQAAGLIPPPEPRLTLQNFIRVLGDQAYADPSQMEQKVMEQIQARQRAHLQRNEQNKLTKEQRAAKRAKKLQEDTSAGVNVALFFVKDMSHPYHRTKVDLNAQQNNITGGVLECQSPALACVICEGGPKAIKRYIRLMTVRMKWTGPDNIYDDDDDDFDGDNVDIGDDNNDEDNGEPKTHKFNPNNKCELVWQGMAAKRFFKGFVFQACETSDQAKQILRSKGVGHFWDQVITHASGRGEKFQLKLALNDSDDDESDDDDNNNNNNNEIQHDPDGDVEMKG